MNKSGEAAWVACVAVLQVACKQRLSATRPQTCTCRLDFVQLSLLVRTCAVTCVTSVPTEVAVSLWMHGLPVPMSQCAITMPVAICFLSSHVCLPMLVCCGTTQHPAPDAQVSMMLELPLVVCIQIALSR